MVGGKFENQITRPYTAKYKIEGALSENSPTGYESWRHVTVGQVHCKLSQTLRGVFDRITVGIAEINSIFVGY